MDFRFKKSIAPIKRIKSIQFGVLSPQYILDTSVTKSIYSNGQELPSGIFDQNNIYDPITKKPVLGGVNDPRMGNTIDPENPGYFGHIELARPVYHYGFINIVLDILRCVSYYTSKIIIKDEDLEYIKKNYTKKKRLKEILRKTKSKTCKDTKRGLPSYSKDGIKLTIEHTDPDLMNNFTGKQPFSAIYAYSILEKISDEDVISLGLNPKFCRPEWLLISVVPVPPPHVRPSVSMSSSQRCEDDLTHKLNDILKSNIALSTAINNEQEAHMIEAFENLLQYHVATFFDNKIQGQKPSQQRSGKPLKTLRQRLITKEGRVRGNLMGKRVDFSARTVITADPNLSIDQVGVPQQIALNLTVPETVTDFNKEKLQKLVENGPEIHPGARYIVKEGGKKVDLRYFKKKVVLRNGWVVERHLDNDDIVLFNRQPSLHKMSIMGHRVKIQTGLTFRLNLSVTSPYNADFDGDEMNLHVPQSIVAKSEAENLMMVHKLIVSPQSNRPVMGIIQDSLLATAKMTKRGVFIERDVFMNLIMRLENEDSKIIDGSVGSKGRFIVPVPAVMVNLNRLNRSRGRDESENESSTNGGEGLEESRDTFNGRGKGLEEAGRKISDFLPLWSGKQVFSMLIPEQINMRRKSNEAPDSEGDMTPTDTKVLISKGELISGIVDKKTIGASQGGLIHILFLDLGPHATKKFMNGIQKLANYWILNNSFSVGIGDAIADDETIEEVDKILVTVKKNMKKLVKRKDLTKDKLEALINSELNGARDEAGKVAQKRLKLDNNFKATVSAGSKGNNLNISQILAIVGQQNVEGKRVSYGFQDRTLPHYKKNDIGQESRGFVENSYLKGLTPQEFFFHAMAGREGLIDTA